MVIKTVELTNQLVELNLKLMTAGVFLSTISLNIQNYVQLFMKSADYVTLALYFFMEPDYLPTCMLSWSYIY